MASKFMLCSFKTCPWVQRAAIVLRQKNVADDRFARDSVRLRMVLDLPLDERRPDIAGADGIAGDAGFGALEGDDLGQADDAVLGRDIG